MVDKIKISDVFELPLTRHISEIGGDGCIFDAAVVIIGKNGLHIEVANSDCGKNDAEDAIVTAINAYDANQERIDELEESLIKCRSAAGHDTATDHADAWDCLGEAANVGDFVKAQYDRQQQEIAELKAELEQHGDQITNIEIVNQEMLAVSDASINKLVDENNGLKAMVIVLHESLSKNKRWVRCGIGGNCSGYPQDHKDYIAITELLNKTPVQHLASVQADAVKEYVDSFDGNCEVMVYKSWIKKDGAAYANKLREQK